MPPNLSETPEEFEVKARVAGRRLDAYLAERYAQLSRAVVRKLIDAGAVLLNGQPAKASAKVRTGDLIRVWLPDLGDGSVTPEDIPIHVVHEDDAFVVVDKAPGMIVHPARGNWSGTLVNALQFHFDTLSSVGGKERPGVVHRLDRDTSGLVIVAKDDEAHRKLALQFETRSVKKEYLALVYGEPTRDRDVIDRAIGRHPTVREKMAIRSAHDGAKPAVTAYEVAERFRGYALIRARPETGRTHQIRVHLTHAGLPIIADKMYAGRDRLTLGDLLPPGAPPDPNLDPGRVLIDRQALHAHRLRFTHPVTGAALAFEAPLPPDMAATLAALRQHRATTDDGPKSRPR